MIAENAGVRSGEAEVAIQSSTRAATWDADGPHITPLALCLRAVNK
jgi:hypothetical protein